MRLPWPSDTIAMRFALTQVLALAVTLGLIGIFDALGGVWSQQPLEETGLLNEVADIVRIIEAAPSQQRPTLAAAAATKIFQLNWYPANSSVATTLDATRVRDSEHLVKRFFDGTNRRAIAFERDGGPSVLPGGPVGRGQSPPTYVLAVQFADSSWLVFTALTRTWGLPEWARLATRLTFLGLSILLVSVIAARRVSRPVEQLAEAVRRFGVSTETPPIGVKGPIEIRNVIKIFNAMQAQIQKLVAYRTMMLAAISHDLRTPLTRIRLRGEYLKDPDQQAGLFRDVDEMRNMIDGALAFFRDDATDEATTDFDMQQLLYNIVNDYADQDIGIAYTGPAHARYRGRPFALRRAFTNVIENALKYATPPTIELTCTDSAMTVAVRDCGPGIPAAAIKEVFRPYFRLDRSRNRTTGGVGLGLTAAQAIVHGHGGEILLENLAQGGLEARIILPAAVYSVAL